MRSRGSRRTWTVGLLLALTSTALLGATSAGAAGVSAAGVSAAASAVAGPARSGFASSATVRSATVRSATVRSAPVANRPPGHEACPTVTAGYARCLSSWVAHPGTRTGSRSAAKAATAPTATTIKGLRPADIHKAYDLPSTGGKGQTIAIVDAFDDPKAEADLKVYRSTWKLSACTTANKCFRKVNQRGGTKPPVADEGWSEEISLDVQAVSAVCPNCRILLVEADDNSSDALGTAENTAVRLGATVVSNSYGEPEQYGIAALGKKYYTYPGVPIVASSGDSGFQDAEFPADLAGTWAIGGTLLTPTSKGGWAEEAADFASSGCSAWIAKPSYQKDTHCGTRTIADISAAADGEDGFAVYDTYDLGEDAGWVGSAGTSLSSPLVAAMIGLAGNPAKAAKPSYAYAHHSGLKDVVGGSNVHLDDCGGDYLCNGVKGYDGPTGLGSPHGLKAL